MMSIADDVVGGFNDLLSNQRAQTGNVIVTLAQFDTEDPFELLIDRVPLREVTDMARESYQPRGGTPLLDSVGRLLSHADAAAMGDEFDHVVAIITDGHENASSEFTRKQLFETISKRRDEGWVFIFLGAEQESYADARDMSVAQSNTRAYARTGPDTRRVMRDMSEALTTHRSKSKEERFRDKDDFYGDGGEDKK
jgi:hypothetical protein